MAMAGGLPSNVDGHHAVRMAKFLLNIQQIIARINAKLGLDFQIRMGMNVGPVVTGVIGTQKVRPPPAPLTYMADADAGPLVFTAPAVCLRCLG